MRVIGFVGAGSMAAAMARGWLGEGRQLLFTDSGSGRAGELARELGGRAMASNRELAEAAELVVLAIKPAGLDGVAAEITGTSKPVVSLLGATPLATVAAALPGAALFRVMPNVAVEVRRGVLCLAAPGRAPAELEAKVRGLLQLLGHVVDLPDAHFDAATAVMGCAPAYLALVVEALIDSGAAAELDPDLARELVVETAAGTAELLRRRQPLEVRRAVASPGGSTEAGLEALERLGARPAFEAAVLASLERMRG